MFFYLILFFLVAISLKDLPKEKKLNFSSVMVIILILAAGLRKGIGTDYGMYKSFYFFPSQPAASKVEVGFIKLIGIARIIFKNKYYMFFLVCSTITIGLIYLTMKKKSKYPMFSLLMFMGLGFYTMSFNMIRQFIAIAIIMYSLIFIEEKKFFKYFIAVAFVSLFHVTAIIMLPIYFFANLNFNKRTLKILFIAFMFFGIFFTPLFNYVVNNIPQYAMYKNYANSEAGLGTYLIDFVYLFIIYFTIKYENIMVKNNYEKICVNISIFAVPMIVLSMKNILFARMIYYFLIPILIPFANILDFFKIKRTQSAFNLILVLILLVLYILNIISFNGVYPYASILW